MQTKSHPSISTNKKSELSPTRDFIKKAERGLIQLYEAARITPTKSRVLLANTSAD